jgi:hydrogenase expression/formation protein HypE
MGKKILLAHGSGGKLTQDLIREIFLPRLSNPYLRKLDDAASIDVRGGQLAFTTDSFVVKPLFFPGGDIAKLAVYGTVNDLAVTGAEPLYICCGLIIEEGLDYSILEKIADSLKEAALESGVKIVCGDIKVVEKGGADKLFINTSGIGRRKRELSISNIQLHDKIIINGTIAEHGLAVLISREGFEFKSLIESDSAPLNSLISRILKASTKVKFMRDPTRGGLATTLNEIIFNSRLSILLQEDKIPIKQEVKGVCELLGFDPLYIANEGKLIVIVDKDDALKVLNVMRRHKLGKESQIIGEVLTSIPAKVALETEAGGRRVVDMLLGEQIPRIC